MAILEVLQLHVKPGLAPTDPSILKSLQSVRTKLKDEVTNTASRFYQCIEDPAIILVLGIWPSLAAHQAFLDSPGKPDILRDQEECLDFKWVVHTEIDKMSSLPLDAPILAIERVHVKGGQHVMEYDRTVMKNRVKRILEDTKPYSVVMEWRCDSGPGKQESLIFTGFETMEASRSFSTKARAESPEWVSMMDHLEETEVMYGRDMEGRR
jgi:hypothetical protein